MTALRKSLEELSDEEKDALMDAIAEPGFFDAIEAERKAVDAIRARFRPPDGSEVTLEDLVTVLNYVESLRIATHVSIRMVGLNVQRINRALKSAACSYCDWMYRDEAFEWPADREITDADIAAIDERIKAAIRQHVKVCPAHPMRFLERRLNEAEAQLAQVTGTEG